MFNKVVFSFSVDCQPAMKNSLAVYCFGLHDRDCVPVALENCAGVSRSSHPVLNFIQWCCARCRDNAGSYSVAVGCLICLLNPRSVGNGSCWSDHLHGLVVSGSVLVRWKRLSDVIFIIAALTCDFFSLREWYSLYRSLCVKRQQ